MKEKNKNTIQKLRGLLQDMIHPLNSESGNIGIAGVMGAAGVVSLIIAGHQLTTTNALSVAKRSELTFTGMESNLSSLGVTQKLFLADSVSKGAAVYPDPYVYYDKNETPKVTGVGKAGKWSIQGDKLFIMGMPDVSKIKQRDWNALMSGSARGAKTDRTVLVKEINLAKNPITAGGSSFYIVENVKVEAQSEIGSLNDKQTVSTANRAMMKVAPPPFPQCQIFSASGVVANGGQVAGPANVKLELKCNHVIVAAKIESLVPASGPTQTTKSLLVAAGFNRINGTTRSVVSSPVYTNPGDYLIKAEYTTLIQKGATIGPSSFSVYFSFRIRAPLLSSTLSGKPSAIASSPPLIASLPGPAAKLTTASLSSPSTSVVAASSPSSSVVAASSPSSSVVAASSPAAGSPSTSVPPPPIAAWSPAPIQPSALPCRNTPLFLVISIDATGSMMDDWSQAVKGAQAVISSLDFGIGDRAKIVVWNYELGTPVVAQLPADLSTYVSKLKRYAPPDRKNHTVLTHPLQKAQSLMAAESSFKGKKGVVMLTDGFTSPKSPYSTLDKNKDAEAMKLKSLIDMFVIINYDKYQAHLEKWSTNGGYLQTTDIHSGFIQARGPICRW